MEKITLQTVRLVNKFFAGDENNLVVSKLIDECGNNLPCCEDSSPTDLERVRFAVIKLSNGNLTDFESAVILAKIDWRDLLVNAEFANDTNAHISWANSVV